MENKRLKRQRRHKRVRSKIKGTNKIPRLCVFRSNKHIYGQLIDDEKGVVLIAASDRALRLKRPKTISKPTKSQKSKIEKNKKELAGKIAVAYQVGKLLAEKAIVKKYKKVVFDRGGYKYHGRIKALAEGTREGGLKF